MKEAGRYNKGHFIGIGIACGLPLGIPIGLFMGNIAIGPAMGLPIGLALGILMEKKFNPNPIKVAPEKTNKLKRIGWIIVIFGSAVLLTEILLFKLI